MRILFAISCLEVGGTEHHALKAMQALQDAGHDVAIVVGRAEGELLAEFTARFEIFTYRITSLLSPTLFGAIRQIRAVLEQWRPDVVHSLDKYSNVLLLPIARLSGVKRVIGSKRWFKYVPAKYHLLNAMSFKFAHAVTANSRAVCESMVVSDGVPERKAKTIWNIVEDAVLARPDAHWITAKRQEFGLPAGAPVVGIVARFNPIKDHDTFVRTMAIVLRERPDAVGVCVGDGLRLESTRALARTLGVASSLRFVGYQPNVPNLNWLFDVAVLTSTSEGSPNSVLEAMAAGCPVVASRVGGLLDATAFGPPTVLCEVGNSPEFARQILSLLRGAPEADSIRDTRTEMIRRQFSGESFVRDSERVYGLNNE